MCQNNIVNLPDVITKPPSDNAPASEHDIALVTPLRLRAVAILDGFLTSVAARRVPFLGHALV